MTGFLLVLSSPSGGGKTTIAKRLLAERRDVGYSVSATTRAMRPGEVDGRDYHFLTREGFLRLVEEGAFLEWAEYAGNLYGTLRSEVDRIVGEGRVVVLDIEVQGARQLRSRYPGAVHVFVLPPSAEALVVRLRGRNTEDGDALRRRLTEAAREIAAAGEYDYAVVNDDLDHAVAHVGAIIDAEARHMARQPDLVRRLQDLSDAVAAAARAIPAAVPAQGT